MCGTDWTPLFKNKFFYSRFDHSLGCALIVWNFTHDKKQTIAALLHDVSTPAFSHVIDFKNGDALKQKSTEGLNQRMIRADAELAAVLAQDGLSAQDVDDYHKYSVCDNEVPQLSADRLEYMFPSGAALQKIFSLRDVKKFYNDLVLAKDEHGKTEFAFRTKKIAFDYFTRCLKVGWILQRNEDKMAMQLLAQVVDKALKCGTLFEQELYSLTEKEIIARWNEMLNAVSNKNFSSIHSGFANQKRIEFGVQKPQGVEAASIPLGFEHPERIDSAHDFLIHYKTFRTMKKIRRSSAALKNHFCVNLEVKRRYINPLVLADGAAAKRICDVSKKAARLRQDFLSYHDAPFGCVPLAEI